MTVPIPDGSILDLTIDIKEKTSSENINKIIEDSITSKYLSNRIGITYDPIVSSDVVGNSLSGLVDGKFGAAANPAVLANNLFRQVYFSSFNDNTFEIDLPGRTDIEVGKLIKLAYPNAGDKPMDATYDDIVDPLLTGPYLITAIKHKFDSVRHTMKVEIVKNGLAASLGEIDDKVVGENLA